MDPIKQFLSLFYIHSLVSCISWVALTTPDADGLGGDGESNAGCVEVSAARSHGLEEPPIKLITTVILMPTCYRHEACYSLKLTMAESLGPLALCFSRAKLSNSHPDWAAHILLSILKPRAEGHSEVFPIRREVQ